MRGGAKGVTAWQSLCTRSKSLRRRATVVPRLEQAVPSGSGEGAEPGGSALPREARITASAEIRALFRRGKRRKTRHLDVFVSPSPAVFPRIGLVVPRHRHSAVARNRLKRRLREIGRIELLPRLRGAGQALDLLVRARPDAYRADFAELRTQLVEVVEKLCSGES